jgi:hypothetical protein
MNIEKVGYLISKLESEKASLSKEETARRIEAKLEDIRKDARRGNERTVNDEWIQRKLAEIEDHYQSSEMSIEEVEKEIEEIYGDQSKNETYYFSERSSSDHEMSDRSKNWLDFMENFEGTLDEVKEEVDSFYGDQSDNSTYYPGRDKGSSKSSRASSKKASNWYEASKKK